jgi:hypothetical protein
MRRLRLPALLVPVLLLVACAAPERDDVYSAASAPRAAWHPVLLPGKEPTAYRWTSHDGRSALSASSTQSASLWRLKVDLSGDRLGVVRFGWWVDGLIEGANVGDAAAEDAPARVIFAFAGDESKLSQRTRMLYDLAEAVSGERPPYATLMYVYATDAPVGSLIHGPRSDRIRKIVLDSGPEHLRQWRDHRRDLRADFRAAFGEEPGTLVAVAVMTDSDNTRSHACAWYTAPQFD